MCGISGVLNLDGRPVSSSVLEKMVRSLAHRGPDDAGIYVTGPLGLGHSRLSIIDLAGGHQPMHSAEGGLSITFNGEIFNFVELRERLEKLGYKFATRSDTEVILHLYREYGTDCVRHMNGQWAFGIWDAPRKRLFLSRDRLGVRPLFYTWAKHTLVFGSEIKALLAHPEVTAGIDYEALRQIFTFWFAIAPKTIFTGIEQLPPAHSLVVEDGSATVSRYWELDRGAPELVECGSAGPEANLIAELRELLTDSTRIRLRADVPVGAYVSGGLDSSITAALAQQCVGSSLHTFSLSFDEPELDESEYQLEVIRALGTRHHMLRCSSGQIGEAFPDVMWHVETPIVRSAPAPMFLLSRFVRDQGFKVVLTGEGADEFWGGYDIFKEAKVRAFCAARTESRRRPQLLKRLYPYISELQKQSPAYLQAFFRATEKDALHPLFSHLPRWEVMRRSHVFFSDAVRSASEDGCIPKLNAGLPNGFGNWSMFRRAQYLEAAYLLPDYLLSSQGDRVAMAHSLEGRYPFLDYRLVEFAAKIPSNLKMKVLNEKYLLKQAFGKLVPKSVLKRAKQPYRAPQSSSFIDHATGKPTTEYIADMLSPERLRDFGIFDSPTVRKLVGKAGKGHAVSFLDNAALVAIVSTQSLIDQFIVNFDERLSHANDRTRIAAVCN